MRYINKITTSLCFAALSLIALTGCEGSKMYDVDSPDWLQTKIDSIKAANAAGSLVIPDGKEDVYTVGETDFSSAFWTSFTKYYQVPAGKVWNLVFNLNINPSAPNTFKNFALIMSTDYDRETVHTNYKEYGAIRFDTQPDPGNSEWNGDSPYIVDRTLASKAGEAGVYSNLVFSSDTDEGISKLGGKVVLTVDRSKKDSICVTINNGTVKKTYVGCASKNVNYVPTADPIRCFLAVEGSYINVLQTDIDPIGGCTSAADKEPVSMTLNNVPQEVNVGADLYEEMKTAGVSATVTYEEGVTQTVPAKDLMFTTVDGDMSKSGDKTLVVMYDKTFKGATATKAISVQTPIKVISGIKSIAITKQPTHTTYYYYDVTGISISNRTIAFDPAGMEVTATYSDGTTGIIDNSKLTFSTVAASAGTRTVTITTENGKTTTTQVTVAKSDDVTVYPVASTGGTTVGNEDNSTAWWTAFSDYHKVEVGKTAVSSFTNYSSGKENWHNWLIVLCNNYERGEANYVEAGVVRSDNYGWGTGYEISRKSGGQSDWAAWLDAMNGAKCNMYITNCGNGTADIQCIMKGTDGKTYIQYYLGINTVDVDNMRFFYTVEGGHLVFDTASSARHYARRR